MIKDLAYSVWNFDGIVTSYCVYMLFSNDAGTYGMPLVLYVAR